MQTRGLWPMAFAALVVGCAAHAAPWLTANGTAVRASRSPPSAEGFDPRRCESLGFVVGANLLSARSSSNDELVESAMIDLRNKAGDLGANFVQYGDPRVDTSSSVSGTIIRGTGFIGGSSQTDGASISGTAYRCEEANPSDAVSTAAPPSGAAGFAFGGEVGPTQAACEAKYQWSPTGDDTFQCSGTPRSIGLPARAVLKFCDGSLCKAVFVVHPDSDQSSEWVRSFALLRKTLVAKYGDALEDRVVPDECADDVLSCVRSGAAHVKYLWKFPNKTAIALVLTNNPGPDPVIRLTYALATSSEGPAL